MEPMEEAGPWENTQRPARAVKERDERMAGRKRREKAREGEAKLALSYLQLLINVSTTGLSNAVKAVLCSVRELREPRELRDRQVGS